MRIVPEAHERFGDGLDERRRAADVHQRPIRWARRHLGEHLPIYTTCVAGPSGRLLACQRMCHLESVVAREPLQLVPIDDVLCGPTSAQATAISANGLAVSRYSGSTSRKNSP